MLKSMQNLTQRQILNFLLPLSFSFLIMTIGSPWIQAVISRKPDAETQLAAFGLALSLAQLFHSPIINMLTTSNALARDRQSYLVLRRLMMALILILTILPGLMAVTPLLDIYMGDLLGVPDELIEAARPTFAVVFLSGVGVGIRRFHQGMMIQAGHNNPVWQGTIIRLIIAAGGAFLLGIVTDLPGAVIGGLAFMTAVSCEGAYAWYRSRSDVKRIMNTETGSNPLTMRDALSFHIPLALTSLLALVARPVIERGLAQTPDATTALAAWPVIFALLMILRAGAFAWPSVVVSLNKGSKEQAALYHFAWRLGLGLSLFMVIFSFTPLINIYVDYIIGAPDSLRNLIVDGVRAGCLMPLILAFSHHCRGVLMVQKRTHHVYVAMMITFFATTAVMWGGVALGLPGIPTAILSMTFAEALAFIYLAWAVSQREEYFPLSQTRPSPAHAGAGK